uniref:Uncharacterized protein n=1 Tax=Clytia hemisphaerica TaxID=252671 RepID=A0A7M5UHB0_9CNID
MADLKNFNFNTGISSNGSRFAELTDQQIETMMEKKNAKNTDQNTSYAVRILEAFCKHAKTSYKGITSSELDKLLSKLYVSARTAKGDLYKLNSMKAIRSGLQRHFIRILNVDIITDETFRMSNLCFENVLKQLKFNGKGETEHYPEIEPEDLQKLYSSFDLSAPTGLFEKVWFDIMFQLIRRGRENLRSMTKSTFAVGVDAVGKRFIHQAKSELDKNHNINDGAFDTTGEGRIYETNTEDCPVKSFVSYLDHLNPALDSLWQKPRIKINSAVWYCSWRNDGISVRKIRAFPKIHQSFDQSHKSSSP